jgi:hypothetical protein
MCCGANIDHAVHHDTSAYDVLKHAYGGQCITGDATLRDRDRSSRE